MCETTIYCDMSVTILMGKSGKCVTTREFQNRNGWVFSAREVSVCEGSRSSVLVLKGRNSFLKTDQHKTNENLTFMSPVHVHSKERTSNGAYWRVHAQLEARLYTWRGAAIRGVLKTWNPLIKHPDEESGVPERSWILPTSKDV